MPHLLSLFSFNFSFFIYIYIYKERKKKYEKSSANIYIYIYIYNHTFSFIISLLGFLLPFHIMYQIIRIFHVYLQLSTKYPHSFQKWMMSTKYFNCRRVPQFEKECLIVFPLMRKNVVRWTLVTIRRFFVSWLVGRLVGRLFRAEVIFLLFSLASNYVVRVGTVNFIIKEWSKLAQKEYKNRHDWVGKVIH